MNIGALLPRHARYRPDHLALVVGDQRLTYRKLNAVVNRLANALLANGVTNGDKIATVLPILQESFNAERVIRNIEREQVTHIVMVPSQIIAVLNSPAFTPKALASLEMIHNVGAPLLLEYKHRLNGLAPFSWRGLALGQCS